MPTSFQFLKNLKNVFCDLVQIFLHSCLYCSLMFSKVNKFLAKYMHTSNDMWARILPCCKASFCTSKNLDFSFFFPYWPHYSVIRTLLFYNRRKLWIKPLRYFLNRFYFVMQNKILDSKLFVITSCFIIY